MFRFLIAIVRPVLLIGALLLVFQFESNGQQNRIVENGAIYKFRFNPFDFQKRVIGSFLGREKRVQTVKTIDGDTVHISLDSVRKYYLPDQIRLYDNGRFHYSKGKVKNITLGFAGDHFNFDYVYGYRLNNELELGVGVGLHVNSFIFYTTNEAHFVNIEGLPLFIQAKYAITKSRKRLYVKGRIGKANNLEVGNIININKGLMLEGGIGVMFAGKNRTRYFFELSQYTSYAKGKANIVHPDILSDVEFNVWFNRLLFTVGMEFGK